ncbi:MAG: DUF4406 domain-containing protein [Geothrix sp.]|nr:DUF4406 domain-containing protein [Geothrix sp.]
MNQLLQDLNLPRRPMGYLSAPMSAPDALTRAKHRFLALDASHHLWEAEILHYCPMANAPIIGTSDVHYEVWMAMDLEVLRRCDYILLVGEWGTSAGCRRELAMARSLGKPVVFNVEDAITLDRELLGRIVS